MYSPAILEAIRQNISIVNIIGQYVNLKAKGDTYWGNCPFHAEKTPSFTVTPSKGFYHCFGCKAGGDVFKFVSEIEKISYYEAVKLLATKAGVQLNEQNNEKYAAEQKKRAALLDLYQKVCGVYEHLLWHTASGKAALAYLQQRALSETTIKKFKLGYTHQDGKFLYPFLLKKGYSEDFLAESGLFSRNYTDYSLFTNRISFPVVNTNGEVLAFSCRSLPQAAKESPKYINSPDTLIYHKREQVYGLYQAKETIRQQKQFILCEGSIDVCALHQLGYGQAVAPLGSAFTNGQAALLKRYADTALLLFDNDETGQKAMLDSAVICEEEELEGYGCKLVGAKDAAEILQKNEGYILTKAINNASLIFDYLLTEALSKDGHKALRLEELSKQLFTYIRAVKSAIKHEAYLRLMADRMGISYEAIVKAFEHFKKTNHIQPSRQHNLKAVKSEVAKPKKPMAIKGGAIYELLLAFLARPDLYQKYGDQLLTEYITDERLNEVVNYLKSSDKENLFVYLEEGNLAAELKDFFKNSLKSAGPASYEERAQRALCRLEIAGLEQKALQIITSLNEANAEEVVKLLEDKMIIASKIQILKTRL
ncbi:MAG: DNA primase [Spirochaetaceae bacterium]|nr:DNA primase [Spirochaetaceae bacterium]